MNNWDCFTRDRFESNFKKYDQRLGIDSVWVLTDPTHEKFVKLLAKIGFALVESKPNDLIFRKR